MIILIMYKTYRMHGSMDSERGSFLQLYASHQRQSVQEIKIDFVWSSIVVCRTNIEQISDFRI